MAALSDGVTESSGLAVALFQTLAGVARLRTSAAMRPLRSSGDWPIRMNGLVTGPAVCQATDIWLAGSAPKAMCLPNGG